MPPDTKRLAANDVVLTIGEARGRIVSLKRGTAAGKSASFLFDQADRTGSIGCRATPDGPLTFDLPGGRSPSSTRRRSRPARIEPERRDGFAATAAMRLTDAPIFTIPYALAKPNQPSTADAPACQGSTVG